MPDQGLSLTERPAWAALRAHHGTVRSRHLRELFAEDPERGERLAIEAAGVYLDCSKNQITEESGQPGRIEAMFRGDHKALVPQLNRESLARLAHDSSTNSLIRRIVAMSDPGARTARS